MVGAQPDSPYRHFVLGLERPWASSAVPGSRTGQSPIRLSGVGTPYIRSRSLRLHDGLESCELFVDDSAECWGQERLQGPRQDPEPPTGNELEGEPSSAIHRLIGDDVATGDRARCRLPKRCVSLGTYSKHTPSDTISRPRRVAMRRVLAPTPNRRSGVSTSSTTPGCQRCTLEGRW